MGGRAETSAERGRAIVELIELALADLGGLVADDEEQLNPVDRAGWHLGHARSCLEHYVWLRGQGGQPS